MVPSTFSYLLHLEILGAACIVPVAQTMGPARPEALSRTAYPCFHQLRRRLPGSITPHDRRATHVHPLQSCSGLVIGLCRKRNMLWRMMRHGLSKLTIR
ncbi:hypothetical protein PSPO01_00442 [Paraphaeosphaeria sporulosa]